jgi:hypothetical protein
MLRAAYHGAGQPIHNTERRLTSLQNGDILSSRHTGGIEFSKRTRPRAAHLTIRRHRRHMSSVFRRTDGEQFEASASWILDEQIGEVALWLNQPENGESVRDSILDIGFNSRLGERVAVQGESVPVSFMQKLVKLNVELWLSIYPP